MIVDFTPIKQPEATVADIQNDYNHQDLIDATNEMIDQTIALIKDLPDWAVTFEPEDPDANDPGAATEAEIHMPWTLGHVIVHTTASAEEGAAHGATLARGAAVRGRNRYETPWTEMQTIAQLIERLEESRRIRLAYLNAWPDAPHYDNLYTRREDYFGALNCVGYTLVGLNHEMDHWDQIQDIVAQAKAAGASGTA
jgi:hypothetical protein